MQEIAPMRLGDWGLPSDAELVLFAGRLSPEKNLFVLLEALDLVLDRHPKAVAVLFGEGPLLPEIAKRIQSSRFSGRYRLRGYTQELWRWIRSAKVVVSISRFEGNPNVVLETMAIGCPLVVSDIPEHKEILRESMAMFCREGSAGDAAVAIGETLSHRDLAKERMERARDRAQIWSVGESASRYLRLYQALVAQGRR
jgi:glycosyltransferase involved in cell wall biosynthesis